MDSDHKSLGLSLIAMFSIVTLWAVFFR